VLSPPDICLRIAILLALLPVIVWGSSDYWHRADRLGDLIPNNREWAPS